MSETDTNLIIEIYSWQHAVTHQFRLAHQHKDPKFIEYASKSAIKAVEIIYDYLENQTTQTIKPEIQTCYNLFYNLFFRLYDYEIATRNAPEKLNLDWKSIPFKEKRHELQIQLPNRKRKPTSPIRTMTQERQLRKKPEKHTQT